MRLRARLVNIASFTKLVDAVSKLTRRVVFTFDRHHLTISSTGDDEDGLKLFGTIKTVELFGTNYQIEANHDNPISLEFTTQALASAIRPTSSSPTEIIIRLTKIIKTPCLTLTTKTVGRSGEEYEVEQRVAVRLLRPVEARALPLPSCPNPEVSISLPKLGDVCKVVERLKSLSDLINVSASGTGGFRLGIGTEHAQVETYWRGLTPYHGLGGQMTQEDTSNSAVPPLLSTGEKHTVFTGRSSTSNKTQKSISSFYQCTIRSRGLLKALHAYSMGQVSLASICEGYCMVLIYYLGDASRPMINENNDDAMGHLMACLPAVNEDADT